MHSQTRTPTTTRVSLLKCLVSPLVTQLNYSIDAKLERAALPKYPIVAPKIKHHDSEEISPVKQEGARKENNKYSAIATGGVIDLSAHINKNPIKRTGTATKQLDSVKIESKDRKFMSQKELLDLLDAVESDLYEARRENHNLSEKLQKQKEEISDITEVICHNQKSIKSATSSLYSVNTFYKDITQIWNSHDHEDVEIREEQIEEIMKTATDFMDSKTHNTDLLEKCIKENEDWLNRYKEHSIDEILQTEEEDIAKDTDERYVYCF